MYYLLIHHTERGSMTHSFSTKEPIPQRALSSETFKSNVLSALSAKDKSPSVQIFPLEDFSSTADIPTIVVNSETLQASLETEANSIEKISSLAQSAAFIRAGEDYFRVISASTEDQVVHAYCEDTQEEYTFSFEDLANDNDYTFYKLTKVQ